MELSESIMRAAGVPADVMDDLNTRRAGAANLDTAAQEALDAEHDELFRTARLELARRRTDRARAALEAAERTAEHSEFVLTSEIGVDADARELARVLADRGWPGDSCQALRRLERKLLALAEPSAD
jgi:hypothetical protein